MVSGSSCLLFLSVTAYFLLFTVFAHEGEDHSKDKSQTTTATNAKSTVTIARAERNIQTDGGQFNVQLQRVPADVRTGETSEFAVRIAEKVEGGFGGGEPLPVEDANVSADITTADGQAVASNLPMKIEDGFYHGSYGFSNAGNYKIVFNAVTSDKRNVSVDFPVSVVKSPVNWTFWLIFTLFVLLLVGTIGAVIYKTRGYDGNTRTRARKVAPVAIAAVLIFVLGTFALAYIAPPRQTRNLAEMPKLGANATVAETEIANVFANDFDRAERIAIAVRNQNRTRRNAQYYRRFESDRNGQSQAGRKGDCYAAGCRENRFTRRNHARFGGRARRTDRLCRAGFGRFRSNRTRITTSGSRSAAARN